MTILIYVLISLIALQLFICLVNGLRRAINKDSFLEGFWDGFFFNWDGDEIDFDGGWPWLDLD